MALTQYGELIYYFIWKDVKVRYKQTAVGILWALIQPLMTTLIFSVFLGHLARLPSEGLSHPMFFLTGMLLWNYFSNSLIRATDTMVENRRVISKVYFPRVILPISASLSGLADFAVGCSLLIVLLIYGGVPLTAKLFLAPVFVLLAVVTAIAMGLWLSALNALYRDVQYVTPFLIQTWMFTSPVIYPSSLVPDRWQWLYNLNPIAGAIQGFRWCLSPGGQAPPLVGVSFVGVLLILLLGLIYFNKVEGTIADTV